LKKGRGGGQKYTILWKYMYTPAIFTRFSRIFKYLLADLRNKILGKFCIITRVECLFAFSSTDKIQIHVFGAGGTSALAVFV
jgi:hypothetical protein